jgi:hypothetical protein
MNHDLTARTCVVLLKVFHKTSLTDCNTNTNRSQPSIYIQLQNLYRVGHILFVDLSTVIEPNKHASTKDNLLPTCHRICAVYAYYIQHKT